VNDFHLSLLEYTNTRGVFAQVNSNRRRCRHFQNCKTSNYM
jgi:hypothetical protein